MKRVGIMGGTFDPIHLAHLLAAEEARFRFNLDKVIFVPCGVPVHKKPYEVTHAEHRYVMVLLAIAGNPYFEVSRIEIERQGPSYAIDTVRAFKQLYGDGVTLYFITGADAVLEILTWKDADKLVELCRFIAVTRPGYDLSRLREKLGERYANAIDVLPIPGMDISSTGIRQRARNGEPIRYMVPEAVYDYIMRHRLYSDKAVK
ncbi:MAG: nicotinate-nucleotide adenylyltransferase [Armatimonadota bacterium]|nr:nicotinate-nucleotide adenylyltransferase [Armatimonadota bacterium]MDW8025781.1 nicotinate-nucleotide adenylyltransferase [Armatimonadota bacterium]